MLSNLSAASRVIALTIIFIFPGCLLTFSHGAASEIKEYKVGVVPQFEQRKLYQSWRPILDRIEVITGFKLTLVGTSQIAEFEKLLMQGYFDIAYMNPYHMVKAHRVQGYLPIARDGTTQLKGVLVVHRDSPIKDLAQLEGRQLAFPSPNALGSSLLLRAELARKFNISVRPIYVKTHSSVYLHVAKHLVDAGGGVKRTLEAQDRNIQDNLRIIYETQGISPHPIALHPRIPDTDQAAILTALQSMNLNDIDRKLLTKIPIHQLIPTSYSEYQQVEDLHLAEFSDHKLK